MRKFSWSCCSFVLLSFVLWLNSSCEKVIIVLSGEKPSIEHSEDTAFVNGVLGKTFHKKFERFLKQYPQTKLLVLEKIPGSINDEWNVKTCLLVHRSGINTALHHDSEIASGGVDLFISGNRRFIEDGAKIGVHSWRDLRKEGSEYPKDSEEHQIFLDFFQEIQMDTSFYWYTLKAASAADIHWMSPDEIEQYKLRK
ncbi:MAG: alpha/beta hydrolase [Bacteroidetes bacterium]|nr:MAG: alpha/beta hydrolase [Bacteroidota bacterium]